MPFIIGESRKRIDAIERYRDCQALLLSHIMIAMSEEMCSEPGAASPLLEPGVRERCWESLGSLHWFCLCSQTNRGSEPVLEGHGTVFPFGSIEQDSILRPPDPCSDTHQCLFIANRQSNRSSISFDSSSDAHAIGCCDDAASLI